MTDRKRDVAAGATGTAGVGVLASTPVRRSAAKVKITDGQIKSSDAKKIVNPGYRPGNTRSIKVMARNLGHLESSPTTVIRYKDGHVIPFDGNHRATARIARGDKQIPVKTIEGGERPAVSVTRNAYHAAQQRVHQSRMNKNTFKPTVEGKGYTGKHAGETKTYSSIANSSPLRSGRRVAIDATKIASGPSKAMLRGRQAATVGAGLALLGGAHHLSQKKVEKRDRNLSQAQIDRKKHTGAELTRATSVIGLGSLAALGAATAAPKLARSGKLTRVAPKFTEEKAKAIKYGVKNKLITAGIVSSGVGGYNGLNNAAWQTAESRQRKKPIEKSAPSPFEDGFYGSEGNQFDVEDEISKVSAKTKFATGYHRGMLEQGYLTRIKSKSYRSGEKVGNAVRRTEQKLAKLPIRKSDEQSPFGVVHD